MTKPFRLLWSAIFLACGCASTPDVRPGTSTSDGWSTTPNSPEPSAATPSPPAFDLKPLLGTVTRRATVARSRHFALDAPAEVSTNASAESYPAVGPGRPFPAGALLVETLPRGPSHIYLAMLRGADGVWSFAQADADGRSQPLDPTPCERCHADAPNHGVFGTAAP